MAIKILVLEDDLPSLKLMHDILEMHNYQVIEATDGLKALTIAEQEKPNLAIIDVMLPTLNGFQVCERLRSHCELKNIPIIVLTVLNENQHRIRAIEAGANDFLTKPFNRVELLTKIKALLAMQEELTGLVPFESLVQCLLIALGKRDPAAKMRGLRVGYVAERIALTMGMQLSDVEQMKKGAYLQDVGILGLPSGTHSQPDTQTESHIQIGEEMISCFDAPIVKEIIRFHHCNLKSPQYPHDLPDNIQLLINITTVCIRFDQLYYGNLPVQHSKAISILEEETQQGLWPKDVFQIFKQIITTGNFIDRL
jgi:putative two-component system response regulator